MLDQGAPIPIAVTIEPKAAALLREAGMDIFDALSKVPELSGKVTRGKAAALPPMPNDPAHGRARMEPLTILATAVLVTAVGAALERILRVLTRDPVVVSTRAYQAKLDKDGKPIVNTEGHVVYDWSEKQSFVEASESDPLKYSVDLAPKSFHFSLGAASESATKIAPVRGPSASDDPSVRKKAASGKANESKPKPPTNRATTRSKPKAAAKSTKGPRTK